MVNAINLQMTSKGDIATWKANRRKLAYSTVGTPDYVRVRERERSRGPVALIGCCLPFFFPFFLLDLPGNLLAAGLRQGVRLVVTRSDHVRVSGR